MSADEPPKVGELRFTDTGDVEVFDGELWNQVQSLLADPDDAIRGHPPSVTISDATPVNDTDNRD
jgi:hypothetical protein